ncbi:endonuclease/exonuclease/phosphatase family protein [Ruegeria jejuensis]|uniref:endonuclease/exonuclease/phosphatase family protein n=1 Tax=Ruegeria jejuensis TaxID=3233338 RepID=UPI00355C007D
MIGAVAERAEPQNPNGGFKVKRRLILVKIMCLNGWGGKLCEDLLPYVAATAPDIFCLQEVVHSPSSEKDWLTYRDGEHVLPQRANFFRDVSNILPDHVAIFCPAAQGVLWDEDQSVPSQWGLATFVHRSLPIIGQVQGFVHKDYSPVGYGDHPRSRGAHGVRVYDYASDRSISLTHMHGLWHRKGKMDTPERAEQARKLLDFSEQVSEQGDVVVICGGFNVEPDSETLSILGDAGLKELVTGRGFESTRNSHYKKPGRFADYLLVNREEVVKSFDVVHEPEVSDHCPLVLEL